MAVSSRLYSIGWAPARLRVFGPSRLSESAVISLVEFAPGRREPSGAVLGFEPLDQGAEVLAPLLEVAVGVEARAGRGEQDDLA